jgi:hypothetical protein
MAGVAFGVDRDSSGSGLDALTLRRIIMGKWHNTGVTTGLKCSGRSDLKYNVAAGMAVCSMSSADGYTEAYWGGGTTENAVAAGDGTYPRIDTVYMLSNTGSPDNLVHVAVKQGTPAATPTRPTLPTGALELLSFRMPSGGSATSSATALDTYHYAIPYGASLGLLAQNRMAVDAAGGGGVQKEYIEFPVTFSLPTDRIVEFVFDVNFSSTGTYTEWAIEFRVDNNDLAGSAATWRSEASWESHHHSFTTTIPAGNHTANVKTWLQNGAAPYFHYGNNRTGEDVFIGRRFQVWDRGAVL